MTEPTPLELAVVTDIHCGPDSPTVVGSAALTLLERALEALAGRQPRLLVDLGDRLTDVDAQSDLQRLEEVAARFHSFPSPRQHLRGNHDVLERDVQEALLGGSLQSRSLDLAGWHLVFLDTFDGTIGGRLSRETLDWLEGDLDSTSLPCVVFSHQPLDGQPLVGNPIFEVDYAAHAHPDGHRRARAVIEAAGVVRLAVNGHAHWNHAVEVNGVHYLSIQSLVARDGPGAPPGAPTGEPTGAPVGAHATLILGPGGCEVEVMGGDPFAATLGF